MTDAGADRAKRADLTQISKRLSYVLRHHPGSIGAELDRAGWIAVETVLNGLGAPGRPLDRAVLEQIVADDAKGRYEFDPGRHRIRARQGHSVSVDLGLAAVRPPDVLYHGTAVRFLERIRAEGLRPMGRHHVHLSAEVSTASTVGSRRGPSVVLLVDAGAMFRDGHQFFRSANGVWLVDDVPPNYLTEYGGDVSEG